MKGIRIVFKKRRSLSFALLLLALALLAGCSLTPDSGGEGGEVPAAKVFVSILPQKFFVERIGGKLVEVSVLVGPGQNPATYEPLPKQMAELAEASLYFRIGVPFEITWNDRIEALNPRLKVIDTRDGIELRNIEGSGGKRSSDHGEQREVKDPHIWLDPLLVKIQAETIYRELAAADARNEQYYRQNLEGFHRELDALHAELNRIFSTLPTDKLMVFHPAWGYLLDRYGLEQIPIESEGKEPGPRQLAQIIELAKAEGIKVIFVEEQFNTETAVSVAEAVEGRVVQLDPLAEDYFANLRRIAEVIEKEHISDEDSD